MDWQSAFETCPPYGTGPGPYTSTDTVLLSTITHCVEKLRATMTEDSMDILDQYLNCRQEYLHRCCRYYFYRGMLHGTQEALSIWAEEYAP